MLRVPEFKGVFTVDVRSHLFARIAMDGMYEPELAEITLRHLDPDRDAIDVGANVGFYTVLIARTLAPGSRILALEPTRNALRRLRSNLARNGVDSKAVIFEGVSSDETGELTLNTIAGMEEYSSLGPLDHHAVRGKGFEAVSVAASTIDSLVTQHGLKPGFLKIDAEGSEHRVLRGAAATLAAFRPIILSELTDSLLRRNGSSSAEVIEFLQGHGYRIVDPQFPDRAAKRGDFESILCLPEQRAAAS